MPGRIYDSVAGKALFLRADEPFKRLMKKLEAEPSDFPFMVEVPLRMCEEGTVVKHSDSKDRSL